MKISFYTFGCRLNQSETAVVSQTFKNNGKHAVVAFGQPADVVVINTCTVTENGDADTRKLVNKITRTHPRARIALVGCQAQVQKALLAKLPNVDWVVGNARKMDLLSILDEDRHPKSPRIITPAIPRESFKVPAAGIDTTHTRANIKVQDGCDFFCSYCEIPYARGRARSRAFNDIAREARALVDAGHQEIVITGINVGTYRNGNKTLVDVIDALEDIDGLKRIRISSIEPTTVSSKIIQRMAGRSKLCRHLHIPLQSAHDAVLKRMKRKYSAAEFGEFIGKAHAAVKDLCIGTDVIVGFPAETDAGFQETLDRVREWPINYLHVFSYSPRSLAKSRQLSEALPPSTVASRSVQMRELGLRKRRVFYESHVGRNVTALFEQFKQGYWTGLTDNYIRVKVKSRRKLNNRFENILLQELDHQSIIGRLDKS